MSRALISCIVLDCLLLLSGCQISHDLTSEERAILVTEHDLVGVQGSKQAAGKFEKTVDYSSFSTEYTYESEEDATLFILSSVRVERTAANALSSEWTNKGGLAFGMSLNGLKEEPIPLTKQYGSRAKLALLTKDGKPVGNIFHAVIDKKVVMLLYSGIYFDRAEDFQKFIDPKMERVRLFSVP